MADEPQGEAVAQPSAPQVDVKAIQEALEKAQADLADAKAAALIHERTITKQGKELKQQQALDSKVTSLESKLNIIAEMQAELLASKETNEEVSQPTRRKPEDYLARLKDAGVKTAAQAQAEAYSAQADTVWAKVIESGLTDKDEEYWEIQAMLQSGISANLKRAELRVDKVKKKVEVVPESPEKVKERQAKEIEEKARQMLDERGLLKTDAGSPSGGSGGILTLSEVEALPPEEYKRKFPTVESVYNAIKEGKIR